MADSDSRADSDSLLREIAQAPSIDPGQVVPIAEMDLPRVLGHYRLIERLGQGGMGEVHKAHDATLDRPVALKILPSGAGEHTSRVNRFLQEAKSASALNHPNIVTIYEIDEFRLQDPSRVVRCIAMEYIDGSTLRAWFQDQGATLPNIVSIFAQLARGLAKAHDTGIVHRDLKPENVMVTRDGYAKILDFGLAKLVSGGQALLQGGSGPDAETALTRTGAVVGTVGYMSPEQARGEDVDHRTDIFSFGSMLYEAVTGARPFRGETAVDTLHSIVHEEPQASVTLATESPPELHRIIAKCLRKDRDERYQTTKDLAIDLRQLHRDFEMDSSSATHATTRVTRIPQPPGRRRLVRAVAVVASLGAVAALVTALTDKLRKPGESAVVAGKVEQRLRIERLTYSGWAGAAGISPDGKVAAHVVEANGLSSLWVRQVATSSSLQIAPPGEYKYLGVTISPDGNYIYFVRSGRHDLVKTLYRIPMLGGAPQKLVRDIDSAPTFSPDGSRLAFTRFDPAAGKAKLVIARADGSKERQAAVRPFSSKIISPAWSPDGRKIAVAQTVKPHHGVRLFTFDVATGSAKRLTNHAWTHTAGLSWHPSGRTLYVAGATRTSVARQVWRVAYPAGTVSRLTNDPNDYAGVSVSKDAKVLLTSHIDTVNNLWMVELGRRPNSRQITTGAGHYLGVSALPDGRLVYSALERDAYDIWLADANGRKVRRLTSNSGANVEPAASPKGDRIAFISDRTGSRSIWIMRLDGSRQRQLTREGEAECPVVTPDGEWVVYRSLLDEKKTLWRVPIDGGDPIQITKNYSHSGVVSPDGKLLAAGYWSGRHDSPWKLALISMASGQPQRTLELPSSATFAVRWTPSGDALSYIDHRGGMSNVWLQPIEGPPRKLTEFQSELLFDHRWMPDGKQLILVRGLKRRDLMVLRDF